MEVRGVRGATVASENTKDAIIEAARDLLEKMAQANGIHPEDVASVFFSTTRDLNADFPAVAARQLGWIDTALMCFHEMDVPHGLARCVRILIHWNTEARADQIRHVYIRGAEALRPDLKKQG